MAFMQELYDEHRRYAACMTHGLQKQLDLLCCLDETVCENYEIYANVIDEIDFEVTCEIDEWQENQDLPTTEKIDSLVVELLRETLVDETTQKPFAVVLEEWRYVQN